MAHTLRRETGTDSPAHPGRGGAEMTTQPNTTEIQRFFELLYSDVEDGWLVLSRPDPNPTHVYPKTGKRWLRSEWLDLAQTSLARVAAITAPLSAQDTVYFGVAIQR